MAYILIVEDDIDLGQVLLRQLREIGHDVELVGDAEAAIGRTNRYIYDLILTDLKLPGMDGIELLKKIKASNSTTMVIVMTGYASVDTAVVAMKTGAKDFIQKPFSLEDLIRKIDDALAIRRLKNEVDYLRHRQTDIIYRTSDIIGVSRELKHVLNMVTKVAGSDSTVLITGETGVGKGLIAGAIHHNSPRSGNNFVQVNCAALPQNLLESELFGHEKGAFTGAVKLRIGRFEQANMGTIFLDEIGDMDLSLQAKVLRVLEDREFERLGGNRTIKVNVRVIAATNKDIGSLVRDGSFREDLYYRINVFNIHIPPIRVRKDDIEPLVHYFIKKYSLEFNKSVSNISPAALNIMMRYDWPGNVREIRNCIERAVLLAESETITPAELSIANVNQVDDNIEQESNLSSLELREKEMILDALEKSDWIQKDAAAILGISKRVIHYKIKKYGITHPRWIKNK